MSGTQAVLDSIAYIAWHRQRIEHQEPGRVVVAQDDRTELHNYAGTAHAGAIYTLAETAAGVAADQLAAPWGGFILLAAAQLRYTRRAQGTLAAEARLAATTDAGALHDEFAASGRGALAVDVTVRDPQGEPVLEGRFDYAIRRRKT
ncbi:MAG: hypothetical protein AMXMBFR66_07680 [Pseudomonadota bacterium]|nr:DUF4442 domain-containing protein [Rubrivivax sp.]